MEYADIIMCGPRLLGKKVGFFKEEPQNAETQFYSDGIYSVCHKKKYPPPLKTATIEKTLAPVAVVGGGLSPDRDTYTLEKIPTIFYNTPIAAWAALQALSETHYYDEFTDSRLGYEYHIYLYPPLGKYYGYFVRWFKNWVFPAAAFLPEWIEDKDIFFQLKVNVPAVAQLKDFLRLEANNILHSCDGQSVIYDIDKPTEIEDDLIFPFGFSPCRITYDQARSGFANPEALYGGFALYKYDACTMEILVGRLNGCPHVRISEEDAANYQYIGLIDTDRNEFIGPAIPIYDAF